MPRASTKKPRGKKAAAVEQPPDDAPIMESAPVAVQEPPPVRDDNELQPPTTPIETSDSETERDGNARGEEKSFSGTG